MDKFYTTSIWDDLAEFGRASVAVLGDKDQFKKQLHAEAKEEGVSLRINTSDSFSCKLHIYLRKVG